mmetsp:Transcript_5236/g.11855  ORF Transcript_5236/g.11855 Transcript_5236/m.11855 type:complete len:116 (+) Transcript_5236:69-416(+)
MAPGVTSDELQEMKQQMSPCIACCCFEYSCTCSMCCDPICFGSFKVCCCAGSLASELCCCSIEPDPCYSEDRGCCEVATKICCCYSEIQIPPGKDIGCGCCGMALCRSSDDAPEE